MADWDVVSTKKVSDWDVVSSAPTTKTPEKPVSNPSMLQRAADIGGGQGIGEAVLNMGTGMLAKPISDVAGLAATAKEAMFPTPGATGEEPGKFQRHVQEALTYQPKSKVGQAVAEYNPMALMGKGIGKVADVAGNLVGGDKAANSLRGMAGNAVREGINQAPPFVAAALKGKADTRLADEQARLATEKGINASKDQSLADARAKGYVFPPSVAGVKGPLASFFQGAAGSTKMDYGASYKNQRVTNGTIKQELGIAADDVISKDNLQVLRDTAGQAYEAVKKAVPVLKTTPQFTNALKNPNSAFAAARKEFPGYFKNAEIDALIKDLSKPGISAKAAIEMQKKLRYDGYSNLKAFDAPTKKALGEAQINAARAIDDLIDQNLNMKHGTNNGSSNLAANLQAARKKIAQTYAVEGALNDTTGNVSARALAKLWKKEGTLTGGLKDVAETHEAFPKQLRDVDKLPATANETTSNLDIAKATGLAALGHGALGVGSAIGRAAVKPMLLSDWYQAANIKPPSYKPGASYTLPAFLSNNPGYVLGIPKPPKQWQQE